MKNTVESKETSKPSRTSYVSSWEAGYYPVDNWRDEWIEEELEGWRDDWLARWFDRRVERRMDMASVSLLSNLINSSKFFLEPELYIFFLIKETFLKSKIYLIFCILLQWLYISFYKAEKNTGYEVLVKMQQD